jgi:hypothetical protein
MVQRNATSTKNSSARARQLLDIVTSSWVSQAAYVAAYLGIPDLLTDRAKSSEELARATGTHSPSLHRLMRALVTIEICREQPDGLYELTPMGAFLRADVADSLRSWTLYWGGPLWSIWGNLLRSVMTGETARKLATGSAGFDRLEADPEAAAVFNRAMVELTRLDAATVVRACDFSGVKRIVDVGGGYGALLAAILQANPAARGVLFDRPHAIENRGLHMEAVGVADRCEFVAGNFFESIPSGADAYVLKSVIHDWNDERSKVILQNCRRAMHERAKLVLVERIVPLRLQASAAHKAIARSDLNMLVGLGGQERTEDEYRSLLSVTGFEVKAVLRAGPTFSVIEAK